METKKPKKFTPPVLSREPKTPLWLSVSEAAKLGGIQSKTIRRAIKSGVLIFRVVNERYQIDFRSLIHFLFRTTKLKNKLHINGIGQFIQEWKK